MEGGRLLPPNISDAPVHPGELATIILRLEDTSLLYGTPGSSHREEATTVRPCSASSPGSLRRRLPFLKNLDLAPQLHIELDIVHPVRNCEIAGADATVPRQSTQLTRQDSRPRGYGLSFHHRCPATVRQLPVITALWHTRPNLATNRLSFSVFL